MDFYDVETVGNTALEHIKPDETYCPIRFQGQWQDQETGLYYNRFRYYEANSGSYMCSDPIGIRGGFSKHGYVDIPSIFIDPLGLNSLRGNIINSGAGLSVPWQAHHLIPATGVGYRKYGSFFDTIGYNIHDASNGIALPSTTAGATSQKMLKHAGRHDAYSKRVYDDVAKIHKKWCNDKNSNSPLVRASADAKARASLTQVQTKYRVLIRTKGAAMPGTSIARAGW